MSITVPNRVPGSGGLPALTRVGNPEGTLGDGQGFDGFTDTDYLTGLDLAHGFSANSEPRLIVLKWKHKPGAPGTGVFEHLIGRSDLGAGGLDVRLRDTDYDTLQVRPQTAAPASAGPQAITHNRGDTYWTFLQFRDPTYAGVGNDWDWWRYLLGITPEDGSGGTGLTGDVEWDGADHTVGSQGGAVNTGAENIVLLELREYNADPSAAAGSTAYYEDIVTGTDDHVEDMTLWYDGIETPDPGCSPESAILFPDPILCGPANVESVTSQSGPITPDVETDDGNLGDLLPTIEGTPADATIDSKIRLQIQRAGNLNDATFVWRLDTETATEWKGCHDGRHLGRFYATHNSATYPNMEQGHAATYVPHLKRIVCAVRDSSTGDIQIRYRDVDGNPYTWSNVPVSLPDDAPPWVDPSRSYFRAAMATLPDGRVLYAYVYTERVGGTFDVDSVAVLSSDDGGDTWELLARRIMSRPLSLGNHAIKLTVSGDWVRCDAVDVGVGNEFISTASRDGGITWSEASISDLSPRQQATNPGDDSPFDVVGVGGGMFLLLFCGDTGDTQWRTGQAFGGAAFALTGTSAALLTRIAPGNIRGIAGCLAHGRVYALISYQDGAGSWTDDQVSLYYQDVERIFAFGPNSTSADDPDAQHWQLVERLSGYRGVQFTPVMPVLLNVERYLWAFSYCWNENAAAYADTTWSAHLSWMSRETLGLVSPGGELTTSSATQTRDPWFDFLWAANVSPGPASATDNNWTSTSAGAPTVTPTSRTLQVVTGAGDSQYWSTQSTTTATDNWVNADRGGLWNHGGTTFGAICKINSGSSQANDSHGVQVFGRINSTQDVQAVVRMDTTGITVYDLTAATSRASIAIDMTDDVEVRFSIRGDQTGTIWAARLDDYFNPVSANFAALTANTPGGTPVDEFRFGALATGVAGDSEWREVYGVKGVVTDDAAYDNPDALTGLPCTDASRHLLTNALFVRWGGASGAHGDRYQTVPRWVHEAGNAFSDASSIQWRSTDLTTQELVLRADDGTGASGAARNRLVHSALWLAGLEDRLVTVEYATDAAFTSPTAAGTLDTTTWSTLEAESVNGHVLEWIAGAPGAQRVPVDGTLAGQRLRFTSGTQSGETFVIVRHTGQFLELATVDADGQLVPADLSSVADGDSFVVFATHGFLEYATGTARRRYMRLTFSDTDTATGDHRLGAIVPGHLVRFTDIPLEWRHSDDEQADVTVFEGPNVSWAYELGKPRRVWTGRLVSDYKQFREALQALARHLAKYSVRPVVLIPALSEPHRGIRGRYQAQQHENAVWWRQDDGDGAYLYPVGDQQVQIIEVP